MISLSDLISRLEQADRGDQRLDWTLAQVIGWTTFWDGHHFYLPPGEVEDSELQTVNLPKFTTSIDGAIRLVPEGHWWTAGDCRREKHARVAPEVVDNDGWEGFGANVAIALCVAALKARQSMEGEG